MKGIDTPILLSILHDTPGARELLKGWRGEELATTEINLFELQALVEVGPRSARSARESALLRLRRRITVLPIDASAVKRSGRLPSGDWGRGGYQALVWGAMAAAGCSEWITTRGYSPRKRHVPFKVRICVP